MRRHAPDPEQSAVAVAVRVDGLERRLATLDTLTTDVAALGRGVAELAAQVRHLAERVTARDSSTPTPSAGPTGTAAAGAGSATATGPAGTPTPAAAAEPVGDGQPDWLIVTDPALAQNWLRQTSEWITDVLAPVGAVPALAPDRVVECWPLHPVVVVELLAAQGERAAAYTAAGPTGVSEWLSRWQPAALMRISAELRACVEDRGHRANGRTYAVPRLDPGAVARWWVDGRGRDPDAVTAFTLTRLT